MIVELIRLEENEVFGTFGVLKINKEVFCVTLEPANYLNAVRISSIPAQQYICRPYSSTKYPNTWQVTNVPQRAAILFHAGNTAKHTEGCILLGQHFNLLKGNNNERGVWNSGMTFKRFQDEMSSVDWFHLTIREVY